MSNLKKLKFKKLSFSSFGGAPLLLTLWNHFDFSLLLTQSGINKKRGVPTWKLAFLFVVGLISRCGSCVKIVDFYEKESLLQKILGEKITQSVFSRFMVSPFQWDLFNLKRMAKFQESEETRLVDGDVIALDDSLIEHSHTKKMPFIYRLFDHCSHKYINAMNIVVLHAKKATGLQYPLLYSIWKQDNHKDPEIRSLYSHMLLQKRLFNSPIQTCIWNALWGCKLHFYIKRLFLSIYRCTHDDRFLLWMKQQSGTTIALAAQTDCCFNCAVERLFSIFRADRLTNSTEHRPGSLVGYVNELTELNCVGAAGIPRSKVESNHPFAKRSATFLHYGVSSERRLMSTGAALVQRQSASGDNTGSVMAALRTVKTIGPFRLV
jgi:hypothetical protein